MLIMAHIIWDFMGWAFFQRIVMLATMVSPSVVLLDNHTTTRIGRCEKAPYETGLADLRLDAIVAIKWIVNVGTLSG